MPSSDLHAAAAAVSATLRLTTRPTEQTSILVAAHSGSIAHSGRARCDVDDLTGAGARVTKAGDATQPYTASILGTDAHTDAPLLDTDRTEKLGRKLCRLGFYTEKVLSRHVQAWRQLLEAGDFDVGVGDFTTPATIAADSLGIPTHTGQ